MKNSVLVALLFCLSFTIFAQEINDEETTSTTSISSKQKNYRRFKQNKFGLSFQTKKWRNTEKVYGKRFMNDSGTLNGFKIDYRYDIKNRNPFKKFSLFFDASVGHVASANTTYDGGTVNTLTGEETPLVTKSKNSITDLDFKSGFFYTFNQYLTTKLAAGFYFRTLSNPENSPNDGSYDRTISYRTFSLNAGMIFSLSERFFIHPQARYDYLLSGTVRTDLSKFYTNDVVIVKKQEKGKGYRLDLTLGYAFNNFTLALTPYYRAWDIADSEIVLGFMEPANTTESIGLDIGIKLF